MVNANRFVIEQISGTKQFCIIDTVTNKYVKNSNNQYIRMSKSQCHTHVENFLSKQTWNNEVAGGTRNNPLSPEVFIGHTVDEAKVFIEENKFDGCKCPCCGRISKAYKKRLHRGIGGALSILLSQAGGAHIFKHIDDLATVSKSYMTPTNLAAAKYWGLTVAKYTAFKGDAPDREVRDSGYWCITEKGMNFVLDKKAIPKYKYVLLGNVVRTTGDDVYFSNIMFDHFSLEENNRVKEAIYYIQARDVVKDFLL